MGNNKNREMLLPVSADNPDNGKEISSDGHVRSLGIMQLIAISFFAVSGGPYGIEDIVSTAPIVIVLLSFLVIPILWSTPIALITAELSSMIPEDGGSVLWVKHGFGGAVGWINGMCSWIVFLFDSAIYPSVMLSYVMKITGHLHPVVQLVISTSFVFLAMCVNLRSALEVGWLAEVLGIVSLAPFVVMIVYAFTTGSVKHVDLHFTKTPKMDLGLLLSLSIWNSAGWEDVGMLAGEVHNPARTFPLGLVGSLVLQTVCNIVPIYVGFGVDHDYARWETGHFAGLARRVGGEWVYIFMLIGSFVSNFGLLHASIITMNCGSACLYCLKQITSLMFKDIVNSSRLVGWMATQTKESRPWLPPFLGRLYSKQKVPRAAVALNCVLIGILAVLPFQTLVQADVLLMCLSYLFLFLTFCILRFRSPSADRPFRLPAAHAIVSCVYIVIPVAIVVLQVVTSPWIVIVLGVGIVAAATVIYVVVFIACNGGFRRKSYQEIN